MIYTVITVILAVVFLSTALSIKSLLSYDSEELEQNTFDDEYLAFNENKRS